MKAISPMALLRGVRVALGLRSTASLVPGGSQALHRQPHPAVVASLPALLSVGNGSFRRDLSASSSATGSAASSSTGRDDHPDLLRHIEGIIKHAKAASESMGLRTVHEEVGHTVSKLGKNDKDKLLPTQALCFFLVWSSPCISQTVFA